MKILKKAWALRPLLGLFTLGLVLSSCSPSMMSNSRLTGVSSTKFEYKRHEVWQEGGKYRFKATIALDGNLAKGTKISFVYPYEITEGWRMDFIQKAQPQYEIEIIYDRVEELVFMATGDDNGLKAPTQIKINGEPIDGSVAKDESKSDHANGADKSKPNSPTSEDETRPSRLDFVKEHGKLKVQGTQLVSANGEAIQLTGVSSHGIQWKPQYITPQAISKLANNWSVNLFRVAVYSGEGGYAEQNADQKKATMTKVKAAIDAAKENGIYVIVDWHILADRTPMKYKSQAIEFFSEISSTYKGAPHIIYEICNEPNDNTKDNIPTTWEKDIKPYAEELIPIIRKNSPDNIIIVGTPKYSSDLESASQNPLKGSLGKNVMYTFHYYAGSHGDKTSYLADRLAEGLPIFVTEWGMSEASGGPGARDAINATEADRFVAFLGSRKISWATWSFADVDEASSLLMSNAPVAELDRESVLSPAGRYVKSYIRKSR